MAKFSQAQETAVAELLAAMGQLVRRLRTEFELRVEVEHESVRDELTDLTEARA